MLESAFRATDEDAGGAVEQAPAALPLQPDLAAGKLASVLLPDRRDPARPSRADIEMTEQIGLACEAIGVVIHDHVIVGKETDASFRSLGLL